MQTTVNTDVTPDEMTSTEALSLALEMLRDIARGKSFESVAFYANVDAMQQALAKATAGRPRKLMPCACCGYQMTAREDRAACPECGKSPAQRLVSAEAKASAAEAAQIARECVAVLSQRRANARRAQQNARAAARLRRLQELDQRDPHALDASERAEMARLLARSIAASKAVR